MHVEILAGSYARYSDTCGFAFCCPDAAYSSWAPLIMFIWMDVLCPSAKPTRRPLETFLSTWKVRSRTLSVDINEGLTKHGGFEAIAQLKATGEFSEMDLNTDQDEHSIEMHLPYVRKIFEG